MSNIYHIRKLHQQRISFNIPLYMPSIKYLTKNEITKDFSFYEHLSTSPQDAYNFTSLEKAVRLMIDLEIRFSYSKEQWQVVLVTEDGYDVVGKGCIDYYDNLRIIEESENRIKQLESLIISKETDNQTKKSYLKKYEGGSDG